MNIGKLFVETVKIVLRRAVFGKELWMYLGKFLIPLILFMEVTRYYMGDLAATCMMVGYFLHFALFLNPKTKWEFWDDIDADIEILAKEHHGNPAN